jgi:hypothetical protein
MPAAAKTNPLPRGVPKRVLEGSPYACFALNESLEIAYCNSAWDRFALKNGGTQRVLAAKVCSRNLFEFIPEELKDFYSGLFARARRLGCEVTHDYECSTPDAFRLFRMQIYPLRAGEGFIVINSLKVEGPHSRERCQENDAVYKNRYGLIRMCANCRRTSRAVQPDVWDWVPSYLGRNDVTHGICTFCLDYYYGKYKPRMIRIAGRNK